MESYNYWKVEEAQWNRVRLKPILSQTDRRKSPISSSSPGQTSLYCPGSPLSQPLTSKELSGGNQGSKPTENWSHFGFSKWDQFETVELKNSWISHILNYMNHESLRFFFCFFLRNQVCLRSRTFLESFLETWRLAGLNRVRGWKMNLVGMLVSFT